MPLLYLEYDGQVYLVRRDGRLTFPTAEEVDFPYDVQHDCQLADTDVLFAVPRLDRFPREWTHKDAVPGMEDVAPVVRRAINGSFIREVTGALILDPDDHGRVLMVKSSRGFTKGMWNMPGGFVQYGEKPELSCAREVKEEVGLDVRPEALLGIHTARFASPYFMRAFVYRCVTSDRAVTLDPTEIAEAAWMRLDEAFRETINPFAREGLVALGVEPDHG